MAEKRDGSSVWFTLREIMTLEEQRVMEEQAARDRARAAEAERRMQEARRAREAEEARLREEHERLLAAIAHDKSGARPAATTAPSRKVCRPCSDPGSPLCGLDGCEMNR
jgi:hypothetical protein